MPIPMTFSTVLTIATLVTGIFWIYDKAYWSRKHKKEKPMWLETFSGLFSVLLIVFVIRSFMYEPFRIPSGSMKPGLLEGDFILVNKYAYGLRFPVIGTKILSNGMPARGDVMVFHYPLNPSENFIKRVIGLPGDTIVYRDKTIYVNGQKVNQEGDVEDMDVDIQGPVHRVYRKQETIDSRSYAIFVDPNYIGVEMETTVPAGHYFMMGDNRDHSGDSRKWGVLPEENIVGKAVMVWLSWDPITHTFRKQRIGQAI
jgi:signal peptidase I